MRDGHRQVVIFRKGSLSLIVFDFEADGRLADHVADAYVAIIALSGRLTVTTPTGAHSVPASSTVVLDPGVRHDVHAPEPSRMLLVVDLVQRDAGAG